MLRARRLRPEETPAENAVLDAVTYAVAAHLRDFERDAGLHGGDPVLVAVDGPGKTQLLKKLEQTLDAEAPGVAKGERSGWMAVSFDAWSYQRNAPPWWWLMSALEQRLRQRARDRGPWSLLALWVRDIVGQRIWLAFKDLFWGLVAVGLLLALWLSLHASLDEALKLVTAVVGGVVALFSLGSTVSKAIRRHLLTASPRGASAVLRSSDPMEELLRRYAFLAHSAGGSIVVLIDNLDRCRADYVVEMLEGIQTLFRDPRRLKYHGGWRQRRPFPFIAFVVAADRTWLCNSYLHVYEEFAEAAREPGRPFGLMFVDKIFDAALRIPTVAASNAVVDPSPARDGDENPFAGCEQEIDVRVTLGELERESGHHELLPRHRTWAVQALADLELRRPGSGKPVPARRDTTAHLDELLAALDPGPAVQRQLEVAYCVHRTIQLLADHDVDADAQSIRRLGLWTILDVRWPLLADALRRRPVDLLDLVDDPRAAGLDADLLAVCGEAAFGRLARGYGDLVLRAEDIKRFTTPLALRTPATARVSAVADAVAIRG